MNVCSKSGKRSEIYSYCVDCESNDKQKLRFFKRLTNLEQEKDKGKRDIESDVCKTILFVIIFKPINGKFQMLDVFFFFTLFHHSKFKENKKTTIKLLYVWYIKYKFCADKEKKKI